MNSKICLIIIIPFISFFSVYSQNSKFDFGINYGTLYPKGLDCSEPQCLYQKINPGRHFGINLKKSFLKYFSNKISLNLQHTKQTRYIYFEAFYTRQGLSDILGFDEGPIVHNFKTLNFGYQFSYTPFLRFPIFCAVGASYNRVVRNKGTTSFKYTRLAYVNSDRQYITLPEPQEEPPFLNDLKMQKGFTVFHLGTGYIFKIRKIEIVPSFNYYFIRKTKNDLADSGINFNIEFYYNFLN